MNIVVQNLLLNYADSGKAGAPVVLMLHGWGSSGATFDTLAAHLATKFRVIRLDLPGFGGSQMPPANWHIQDYAQLVAATAEKLKLGDIHTALGHSFGGRVLIKGVSHGLIKPKYLVLVGSAGVRHTKSVRNQLFKLVAKTGKLALSVPGLSALRGRLRRQLYHTAGSVDYLNAGPLRQIFLNTINEDLQADAARIAASTLLIYGALDTEAPPADGKLLASAIAGSTFSLVAGAGHFVHTDAPDQVAGLIDEFIS